MNLVSGSGQLGVVRTGSGQTTSFDNPARQIQGDCLSAIFFILYLSRALGHRPHLSDHNYNLPEELEKPEEDYLREHNYYVNKEKIHELHRRSLEIQLQYADDCGYAIVTESDHLKNDKVNNIPPKLKKRNLSCNETKNEDYHITRHGETSWEKCKYLGTLLSTEQDIKRRKILALNTMTELKNIWESRLPTTQKLRIFNACVAPVFLSNAELWTTTTTINGQINAFQRRLLRQVLNIKYPKKISNDNLYKIVNQEQWSHYISTQRIRWIGHVHRLPETAPAKQALQEAERPTRRPPGKPKTKWLDVIKTQLITLDIKWDEVPKLAQDRTQWKRVVEMWRKRSGMQK